jgi:hypothetical protein
MTKEKVLREGIVEALRQLVEHCDYYSDDSVGHHFTRLKAHLTGTLMEADGVADEPEAGRCPTCSRWLEQRCPVCGPVENRPPEPLAPQFEIQGSLLLPSRIDHPNAPSHRPDEPCAICDAEIEKRIALNRSGDV